MEGERDGPQPVGGTVRTQPATKLPLRWVQSTAPKTTAVATAKIRVTGHQVTNDSNEKG